MIAMTVLLSGSVYSQSTKRLIKAYNAEQSMSFEYAPNGKLAKFNFVYGASETRTDTYTYATDKIVQEHVEGGSGIADHHTSTLTNGKIIKTVVMMNENDPNIPVYEITYDYTYNDANQLIKVVLKNGNDNKNVTSKITWADGGISNIKQYEDETLIGEINFTYDPSITSKHVIMLVNPLQNILSYEGMLPYGQLLADYYGSPIKHAVKSMQYVPHVEKHFGWNSEDSFTMTYTKNEEGDVVKIAQTDTDDTVMSLEWTATSSGISAAPHCQAMPEVYFNGNGIRQSRLQKGLNIIKSTDGSVRKVLK